MKAIRIVAFTVALFAATASNAAAQDQLEPIRGQGAGAGGTLLRGITLTEAQKAQQKVIREKYAPRLLEIRKYAETTGMPEDEASRAKVLKIQAEQAAELRAILTGGQQTIFDRNLAEIRARREEREKNG